MAGLLGKQYSKSVLGIDIGTTTVKVALVDEVTQQVKKILSRYVSTKKREERGVGGMGTRGSGGERNPNEGCIHKNICTVYTLKFSDQFADRN